GIKPPTFWVLVCDKCPAGTYVSIHCSPTSVRECSPCPKGTFTRGENGVQQCHRCRSPCPAGFIEKTPCTATQDRICTCPPNTFLSGDGAAVCKPHSLCPPGKRVKKQGSEKKDVVCKQCSEGTFSDVKSSATQCRNHTDCQVQGLVLLSPGTREKDNICGPLSTAPSSASTTASGGSGLVQEPIISSIFPAPLAGPAQKGEGWEFCLIIFYLNLYTSRVTASRKQEIGSLFFVSPLLHQSFLRINHPKSVYSSPGSALPHL
uniref:TNFR-Cys domain-containing protein n=1 Tax=Haplochromis burtoni TaxID=8153 RepID=A0A3Q2VG11_HAPBU